MNSIPITAGYKAIGLDVPETIWTGSPLESVTSALLRLVYDRPVTENIFQVIKSRIIPSNPQISIFKIPGNTSTMFQPIAIADSNPIDQLVEDQLVDFFQNAGNGEARRLITIARHSSWAFCFPNAILWCKPPTAIYDANGRPHSTTGPAIEYSTQKIYAMHGRLIPSRWITHKFSVEDAVAVSNIELRRLAFELIGWKNILETQKAELIDRDGDPEIGSLWRADIPGFGQQNFLEVKCGTGRDFVIPVPPEIRTALQANAWSYGLEQNPETARVEIRT